MAVRTGFRLRAQAWRSLLGQVILNYRKHVLRAYWRGKGVWIAPEATIMMDRQASLSIGGGTTIGPYTVLALIDDPNDETPRGSKLTIGRNTALNEFNNIRAGGATIQIGDECLISQFVSIIGRNHSIDGVTGPIRGAAWDRKRMDVSVGNGVWIGVGAIVLPGVALGDGAVIASGAVVTEDVPALCIAGGIPARVIRKRS